MQLGSSFAKESVLFQALVAAVAGDGKIYLENIEQRKRETDEICQRKIAEAESRVESIISGAIATIRQGSEAYFRSILQNSTAALNSEPDGEEMTSDEAAV